jgi:hypothetical protein
MTDFVTYGPHDATEGVEYEAPSGIVRAFRSEAIDLIEESLARVRRRTTGLSTCAGERNACALPAAHRAPTMANARVRGSKALT